MNNSKTAARLRSLGASMVASAKQDFDSMDPDLVSADEFAYATGVWRDGLMLLDIAADFDAEFNRSSEHSP